MQLYGFSAGPFATNTYVLEEGGRAVIVDPGMHAAERISQLQAEKGWEIESVLLTHGHLDHVRDAGAFDVPVWIHPADAYMLEHGEPAQSRPLFEVESMPAIRDLHLLDETVGFDCLGQKMRVVHAPGHSPGSVLVVCDGLDFALVGDVIFQGSIGRTDLPGSDPLAMEATLKGPVADLSDSLQLLPGHGPATTMAAERASNPFLKQLGL